MRSPKEQNNADGGVASPQRLKRILLIRADRLGDVMLVTPALAALRSEFPKAHIALAVRAWIAPVLKGITDLDEVISLDGGAETPQAVQRGERGPNAGSEPVSGECSLYSWMRQDWDAVVFFQWDGRLAREAWRAGIKLRVGPRAKPLSYVLFNRGVRQSRSKVREHEAQYNLDLLSALGISPDVLTRTWPTSATVPQGGALWFEELKKRDTFFGGPFGIVHPGMGGSALNWPARYYAQWLSGLLKEGRSLAMTEGPSPSDREIVEAVLGELSALQLTMEQQNRLRVLRREQISDLGAMAALLNNSEWVFAPSTGPLHLANALGRPVVSVYPPIRVQSRARWGPWQGRSVVLMPEVNCPEAFRCRGVRCQYYPCMSRVTPEALRSQARGVIDKH